MSLRYKSLIIFAVTLVLLFGIVLSLVKTIIGSQFEQIESGHMARHAEHLAVEFQEELDPIRAALREWAPRKELHDFVTGNDPRTLQERMPALANLEVDFLGVWNREGRLITFQTNPTHLAQAGVTADQLLASIAREDLVPAGANGQSSSGLMLVDKTIALAASAPIARDDRSGTIAGTLVGGKVLRPKDINEFEEFSEYQVSITTRPDGHPAIKGLGPVSHFEPVVQVVNENTITAAVPLVDICGEYVATADLTSSRLLHVQAQKTSRIFLVALVSAAGILLFVVWYLLDANVIFPVRWLADKLEKAAAKGELPSQLAVKGGRELVELSRRVEDLSKSVASAEANYRAIVEQQTDFIFRFKPDGEITFVNTALCAYFNKPRESFISTSVDSLVAPEDAHRVSEIMRKLSLSSPLATFDHRVRAPDGSTSWFRRTDRAIFSETQELQEIQSVARDVTQTHISRERLEASETRYRRLFETAADGILIVNLSNSAVAAVNPTLCDLLHMPRTAIVGRPLESLPPFNNRHTLRILNLLLEGKQPIGSSEIVLPLDDGDRRYNEVTASFYDEEGSRMAQLNFRDVTLRRRANDELRQLSSQLMLLQDAERRRIARELHDSTAQNLSALQMSLLKVEAAIPPSDEKALAAIEDVKSLADSSVNEIRTISYLLHPPLLDEVGLLFALRWYVDGFMTRTEKIVRLDLPDSLERLPAEIETTIFRIVQEGLTNVHRHSGARRAWIRLAVEDGKLVVEIRDDGHGMPLAPSASDVPNHPVVGVGMAGMRERLRQFDGVLIVKSDRTGTTVRASLPLQIHEPTQS